MTKRKELKERNPQLKNTEISRILGQLWRKTADDEKRPFIEQEEVEREKYKERMSLWREKKAKADQEKKERDAESTAKAIAEKRLQAETETVSSSKSASPSVDEYSFNNTHNIDSHQQQQQRIDSFPPLPPQQQQQQPLRQSPLSQPYASHSYPYEYGQGWQNQDNSQYHNMPPSRQHHGEFHLNSQSNMHEKYNESFDVFHNQNQFGFSDQSQYYDQGQHRHVKLEEGEDDSPYTYSGEFDPVPLH